jgi:hypothetical protein
MKTQNRGQRKLDRLNRFARANGLRNRRTARHWLRVLRLREFLPHGRCDRGTPVHFSVREVADAIGGSTKVIRKAAQRGMIKPERLADKKARKLFFKREAVRRFLDGYERDGYGRWAVEGFGPVPKEYSRVFRSEKIALNPHLMRGDAVTIERAMLELRISRRGVQYYLKRADLKKIPCGHRTVLVTRRSLERLRRRRLAKPERQFAAAKKRLEKIRGCRIETEFVKPAR